MYRDVPSMLMDPENCEVILIVHTITKVSTFKLMFIPT